tara:strand:+ start:1091 stop:1342 length:252 start_codon:yes stop_codon:yes gene_type:complete
MFQNFPAPERKTERNANSDGERKEEPKSGNHAGRRLVEGNLEKNRKTPPKQLGHHHHQNTTHIRMGIFRLTGSIETRKLFEER